MSDVSLSTVQLGITYAQLVSLLNTNFSAIEQAIEDTGDITSLISTHNTAADAHSSLLAGMITNIQMSANHDGIFTITKKDGSTFTIDTMMEKVVTNFSYNETTGNLELTTDEIDEQGDPVVQTVSLARFIDTYVGTAATDTGVVVRVSIDTATKKISATIDNGVITKAMLAQALQDEIDGKVDAEVGKGLSTEDYTTAEKTKLAGIADNANNYVLPTGGTDLGGVKNGGNVVIANDGTMDAGSTIDFTDNDERWVQAAGGEWVLTVASTRVPLKVCKLTDTNKYEEVIAQVIVNASNFTVTSNAKFAGRVYIL
jgi:hypothetical protein